jgi:hypothetical protein
MAARSKDAEREALIAKYMAAEGPALLSGAGVASKLNAPDKGLEGSIRVLPPMYPGAPTQAVRTRFVNGQPVVENVPIGGDAGATGTAASGVPNFPVKKVTGLDLASKYGITGYDPKTEYQLQTAGADAGKVGDIPLADPLARYGGATGAALLQSLSPGDRVEVEALHEGRRLAPSTGTRAKEAQRLLTLTQAAYPDWNATQGQLAYKARQQYLPGGPIGKNIVSFETAISHLGSLANNAAKLGSTGLPSVNAAKNAITNSTGALGNRTALTGFQTDRQAVADELMRAFRVTGSSVEEAKAWRKQFDAAAAPEQIQSATREATNLLAGRLDSLVKPYNDATGENRSFLSWMSPKSRATFMNLNPDYQLTDDDKRFLVQQEASRRSGAPAAPKNPSSAKGGTAIPADLMQQYKSIPSGNKAIAKARLKAAGYDISGLD